MTKERTTVEHLYSGQPRPYADSRHGVQVTFEVTDYKTGEFIPWDLQEEAVRKRLLGMNCGFTEFTYPPKLPEGEKPTASDYFRSRLDFLRKVSPGVWVFQVTDAFTD